MDKKGMSMALGVIITIVVLLIVALILVTIVSKNAGDFSGSSGDSIDTSSGGIQCQTELVSACVGVKSGDPCPDKDKNCPACTGTPKCP